MPLYTSHSALRMADFKRHVTCSSATGVVVGAVAYACGVPPATCLVAAGICGLAGMLPDIDSNSSRSFKTCLHIAAVLGAMLTIQRGRMLQVDHDWVLFAAVCVFFFILYTVGSMIRKLTAHRGMIHSIPAAVIAGQCMYLVSEGDTMSRIVKGLALSAGFLSHLILDEIYSIDSTGKAFKVKKSFGTALKMIDYKHKHITATFYAVALLLGSVIGNESTLAEGLGVRHLMAERTETAPRTAPLKAWLSAFAKQEPSVSESVAVAEPLEVESVNLRPLVRANSGYAENELFRRRRSSRSESAESTAVPSELPDRPTVFRKYTGWSEAEVPPLPQLSQRFEGGIPLRRDRGPATIALTER